MKNRLKFIIPAFYFLLTTLGVGVIGSNQGYAQQKNITEDRCNSSLEQVQNESFALSNGNKQIVSYSLTSFQDNEACWKSLEALAKSITENSEIAGVYFFTLPPNEISKIDDLFEDFAQYGMNLKATYWKDPDSGSELRRYPNNTID